MGYEDRYDPDTDFDRWYTKGTARAITVHLKPGDEVLELGCATGAMSTILTDAQVQVTGVDHCEEWLDRARDRNLPNATFMSGDIYTVSLDRLFDHVVLASVLHEVEKPEAVLNQARLHLKDGGLLHVSIPNPRSLHRLVGLAMGLLSSLDAVGERAQGLETLRMLEVPEVVAMATSQGFAFLHETGVMLKPLPNSLMETLPESVLEGFLKVATDLPEFSAMNYLVFRAI